MYVPADMNSVSIASDTRLTVDEHTHMALPYMLLYAISLDTHTLLGAQSTGVNIYIASSTHYFARR